MPRPQSKLHVEVEGMSAHRRAKVLLNDMDITHMVRSLNIRMAVSEVNTATIEVMVDNLRVESEAQLHLTADAVGADVTTYRDGLRRQVTEFRQGG